MRSGPVPPTNVVPFPPPRRPVLGRAAHGGGDQRALMEAVYAAGSLAVAAEDGSTKGVAARLQVFGFVAIDEVRADGSLRRLKPSEAADAVTARPWRLSRTILAWGGMADEGARRPA